MKRLCDVCFAVLGLIVFAPVFVLVAAGVKLSSSGPVFFQQDRLGRHGKTFTILKFRSMCVKQKGNVCKITAGGDSRITPFGCLLRRTKFDELPQFINVLRGEMSFVGPRPEVPEFAELFPEEYARILTVRPGITHAATLVFRREEEILAKFADPRHFYIDKLMPQKLAAYEARLEQSLVQDIRTIVETVLPYVGNKPLSPEHFAPKPVLVHAAATVDRTSTDFWTTPPVVENVPAFADNTAQRNRDEFDKIASVGS